MKKSVMKKWVDALRSGKYKQTKGVLKDSNGYCCLGVLCDIAPKETGEWDGPQGYRFEGNGATPPQTVLAWAGMKSDVGCFKGTERKALTERNDKGASFKTIAKLIEKDYKLL